jgi:hypothetical protein
MVNPSIYDQLAKESFSALTITQLNAGTSVTAIDQATIDYWKGPLTLARVLEASRTYAGGTLPIPETGAIQSETIPDANQAVVQPQGTEIWEIQAIDSNEIVSYALFDGATGVSLGTTANPFLPSAPMYLTNSLYLVILNTSGSEATVGIAYYKMGL